MPAPLTPASAAPARVRYMMASSWPSAAPRPQYIGAREAGDPADALQETNLGEDCGTAANQTGTYLYNCSFGCVGLATAWFVAATSCGKESCRVVSTCIGSVTTCCSTARDSGDAESAPRAGGP